MKFVPELLYWLGWVSQLVVPVCAIALAIIIMTCVEGADEVYPFLVWVCQMEFWIPVTYLYHYREPLKKDKEYWVDQRNVMIEVNARKRANNISLSQSDHDPRLEILYKTLRGPEDAVNEEFENKVKKYLDGLGEPYLEKSETRGRAAKPRIGGTFPLGEDFYCATWLYYFKPEELLGRGPGETEDKESAPNVGVTTGTKMDQVSTSLNADAKLIQADH